MSLSITSEEINFLVYRYLQESGFTHSAFSFFNESTIPRSNINGANVPPGALISLIQRGLQYKEMETHLNEDGSEVQCAAPFSLVVPHVCKLENDEDGDESMEEEGCLISKDEVLTLRGHTKEVFISAWNPKKNLLASGSGDATARIWRVPSESGPSARIDAPIVLKHSTNNSNAEGSDVTTLNWNPAGNVLATGSYDGSARIWSESGTLKLTLSKHTGPIFSLKWNNSGDYLLSGSMDKTAIVWDSSSGDVKQQFEFHKAPTLDVDWKDNSIFASCSTDTMIYVCELGRNKPLRTFQGHKGEVNAITWSPSGRLLASCSDDFTTKIWNFDSGDSGPVQDFSGDHSKEIYTIKWSPTGPGSPNPNKKLVLATASFDCSIKLWDVEVGKCLNSLTKHTEAVYSVAFSPDGNYIASGSFDKCINIWSVSSGSLVKTYKENAGIFEVSWNNRGDRVAASLDNNNVAIIDFRM